MRILHVSSEYPPQKVFGLGRYVCDLSRELAAQGHEVHVLTNSLGGVDRDRTDRGVQVHRVEFPPPPMPPTPGAPVMAFNVHLQQRAHALSRKGLGDPEVVVSHDWLTAVAGHRIATRFGVPHVWTVHDTVHGKRFGKIEELEDRVGWSIEKWATDHADLILVNSAAIGDEMVEVYGADRDRMRLLHPGIDASSWNSPVDRERFQAFRSVLAGPEDLLITYTGRLDLEKGIDTLINAFATLKKYVAGVRLAIAGRGALRPAIENHLKELRLEKDVLLCGYLEGQALRAFYAASDLQVCPSHYEPFGLVAAEAMAMGAPVVASDTGGLRDIISCAKVGRRFPPGDVASLAGTLLELTRSPGVRRKLGEAGRRHVLQHFAWPVLAKKAVQWFQVAVAAGHPVPA